MNDYLLAALLGVVEGLYGASRFDGAGKMLRAAELLDAANVPVTFD